MKRTIKIFAVVTMCLNIAHALAQISTKDRATDVEDNRLTPAVTLSAPLRIDLMDRYGLSVSITPANYCY